MPVKRTVVRALLVDSGISGVTDGRSKYTENEINKFGVLDKKIDEIKGMIKFRSPNVTKIEFGKYLSGKKPNPKLQSVNSENHAIQMIHGIAAGLPPSVDLEVHVIADVADRKAVKRAKTLNEAMLNSPALRQIAAEMESGEYDAVISAVSPYLGADMKKGRKTKYSAEMWMGDLAHKNGILSINAIPNREQDNKKSFKDRGIQGSTKEGISHTLLVGGSQHSAKIAPEAKKSGELNTVVDINIDQQLLKDVGVEDGAHSPKSGKTFPGGTDRGFPLDVKSNFANSPQTAVFSGMFIGTLKDYAARKGSPHSISLATSLLTKIAIDRFVKDKRPNVGNEIFKAKVLEAKGDIDKAILEQLKKQKEDSKAKIAKSKKEREDLLSNDEEGLESKEKVNNSKINTHFNTNSEF